jgi:CheY-like chemotaxis protein
MNKDLIILIVDDDPVIRTLLEKFLTSKHTVLCAENGLQAKAILSQRKDIVDLLLCDIEMPEMDGVSLLKHVRKDYPKMGVIMISGSSDTRTAITAMREGAYDYITKPFSEVEEVELVIQRWQKQQSMEAKLAQYAILHKEMLKNRKRRTFLAVDVAGSGKIKQGEDPFIVQFVFKAYQDFLKSIVEKHHGTIHSTSGDGAMACFETAEDAVAAARQILTDLVTFNSESNQLEGNFRVRVGIHTGYVVINESGDINDMFAEALDIAGHIQKNAHENSLAISEDTLHQLNDPSGFRSSDKEVDGNLLFDLEKP